MTKNVLATIAAWGGLASIVGCANSGKPHVAMDMVEAGRADAIIHIAGVS